MFPNDSKRLQDHIQRLQQDLVEMESLQRLAPSAIWFRAEGQDPTTPDFYHVEVRVTSFTGITRQGLPKRCGRFEVEIHLPRDYPERRGPECKVYPAPFHPHFKKITSLLSEGHGIWVDPHDQDEGLGKLVLRIVKSLRYDPQFVDTGSTKIGNKEALEWYLYWRSFFSRPIEPWFPSDKSVLPNTIPGVQKKFDIESKTFEIRQGGPRSHSDRNCAIATPVRKTFQITNTTPPYRPKNAPLPQYKDLALSDVRGSCQTHQLFIEPKAIAEIFDHIAWGQSSPENRVEQGGILLGHAFRDETVGVTFGIIEQAIAGDSAAGTSAYLEMDHATWKRMIDQVDTLIDADPNRGSQIIGWYHTHPNQLDVFMSGTDAGTQMRFFSNDWQFAIVLNPHKQIWRAFHGRKAEECQGFIIAAS